MLHCKNHRPVAALLTLIFSLCSAPLQAGDTVRLNFGVYSSNKPSAMVKVYRPILKRLEASVAEKLGQEVDIRMQIAKDYDQGISHLINGRVDFSAFGPASYVEAKRMNTDISILAVENVKSSKVFYGIIAVAKDSPIQGIGDLRGKSFAFGDEGSTIGRFLSQLELVQAGIHAGDLYRYEYLGRHDKVGTAVGAGSFDAGALNEKTFKKLVEAGENIRELVRFPNVTRPWIARSGLDPHVHAALRASLLEIKDPGIVAVLKIDGFLEGDDNDYKVIRKAMENNQVFFADQYLAAAGIPPVQTRQDNNEEPAIQAAVTAKASWAVQDRRPLASDDHLTLTVNITLPRDLFTSPPDKPVNGLTINLLVPALDELRTDKDALRQ